MATKQSVIDPVIFYGQRVIGKNAPDFSTVTFFKDTLELKSNEELVTIIIVPYSEEQVAKVLKT